VFLNDDRPFGGNILVEGGIELLFPIPFMKDQRSMRSGFFFDFGNVFSTDCGQYQPGCVDFDLAELRYSVGVGLTWITGFGPLGFSIAKPFVDGQYDETEVFQFSLGQAF
jgi:outer membrane protein insertion porin family